MSKFAGDDGACASARAANHDEQVDENANLCGVRVLLQGAEVASSDPTAFLLAAVEDAANRMQHVDTARNCSFVGGGGGGGGKMRPCLWCKQSDNDIGMHQFAEEGRFGSNDWHPLCVDCTEKHYHEADQLRRAKKMICPEARKVRLVHDEQADVMHTQAATLPVLAQSKESGRQNSKVEPACTAATITENVSTDDGEEEEVQEEWAILDMLGKDTDKTCSNDDCNKKAVAMWHDIRNPNSMLWNSCLDCQKQDFAVSENGWPDLLPEKRVTTMSDRAGDTVVAIDIDDRNEKLTRTQKRQLEELMTGKGSCTSGPSGIGRAPKRMKMSKDTSNKKEVSGKSSGPKSVGPKEAYHRPAPEFGQGWTVKGIVRGSGGTKGKIDRYWISPKTNKRLRSIVKVHRFLVALEKVNGNEDDAFAMIQKK